MQTGPGNFKIPPGCGLVIRCSKKFTALGLNHLGDLVSVLGPCAETDRTLRRHVPHDVNTLKMLTSKTAHWEYSYTDRHSHEDLDRTPIEIPVAPKELRYEDEMRRIVRDELSRHAEASHRETFEESDDFEIEDDDPLSPYETTEMQEDAEYAPSKSVADDPSVPKPPHRPVGDPPEEQPPDAKEPENPAST